MIELCYEHVRRCKSHADSVYKKLSEEWKRERVQLQREAFIRGAREFTIVQYSDAVLQEFAQRAYPDEL